MKYIEIEGKWRGERVRFGDCLVGELQLSELSTKLAIEHGAEGPFISVKGPSIGEELERNQWYRFYGKWTKYKNKRTNQNETQFEFVTYVPARKHDREGIVSYLSKFGLGNGLGPATANKLFDMFGSDTLREIRENPLCIKKANRNILDEQCHAIADSLRAKQGIEDATVEVTNILAGRRFPKTIPTLAIQEWGNKAAETIYKNPYKLMKFSGVAFGLADRLYLELGRRPSRILRQLYCLNDMLQRDSEGHVWHTSKAAELHLVRTFNGKAKFQRVLELGNEYALALSEGRTESQAGVSQISTLGSTGPLDDFGDFRWLATAVDASTEDELAELICGAMKERQPGGGHITKYGEFEIDESVLLDHATCHRCGRQLTADTVHILDNRPYGPTCIGYVDPSGRAETLSLEAWLKLHPTVFHYIDSLPTGIIDLPSVSIWPNAFKIEGLSKHQASELHRSLIGSICLLGGRPGTGKTWTIAHMILAMVKSGVIRWEEIGIGAPTGKAAVRLTEVMQGLGIPIRARTWHSMLAQAARLGGKWPYKLLIGDESSMIDQNLMLQIMRCRAENACLLLVGDVNQLPPVGRGAPFRDLIAAGLPYGELTEIKRNSGGIVEACAAIVEGRSWGPGDNLKICESPSATESIEWLETVLAKVPDELNRVWDCQVLVAVNKDSKLSRAELNKQMQEWLNQNPKSHHGTFRVDDKVVNTKNGYFQEVGPASFETDRTEKDEVFVANGELGKIIDIQQSFFLVELQSPDRLVKIPFGRQQEENSESDEEKSTTGCTWELGYAISCHRSQGSEWPWVVVMIDDYPGAKRVCSREWVNTAISRAKTKCILIGKKSVADQFCKRKAIDVRKTFLKERIGQVMAAQILEAI